MSIKMRVNKGPNAQCCNCRNFEDESLMMFDICVGKTVLTLCDACNAEMFHKTLVADCRVNGKVKSTHDMEITRQRNQKKDKLLGKHLSINEAMRE